VYLIALMAVGELAKGVIYEHSIKTGYKSVRVRACLDADLCMCKPYVEHHPTAGVHLAVF